MHFDRQALVTAMEPAADGEVRELTLTFATHDGTELEGTDCVWVKYKVNLPSQPRIAVRGLDGRATEILLGLDEAADVSLVVYDIRGRRLRVIANEALPAGDHSFTWDGSDESGDAVASGVYFCRIRAGGSSETAKLIVAPR